ncbi:MAG: phage tail protein [Alcanivoracaceae bacterium]|nr:phage tail protein [Alcanivoracaceae bacterium]
MSEPFLAEIRIVGFNFAPRGWAFCDGQILPINQNQSLYSILGTAYGGDGVNSFALPEIRGRTPIHVGEGHLQAQKSGEETHTLSAAEMPQHKHVIKGSESSGSEQSPLAKVLGASTNVILPSYKESGNIVNLNVASITKTGGGQLHKNMQPYITLNYCIALKGLFPSRN